MIPEIKDQWLRALRNGEYKQGKSRLAYVPASGESQYCCLGVLCDISPFEGKAETSIDPDDTGTEIGWFSNFTSLPGSISEWAGLPDGSADVAIALDDADIQMFTEKLGSDKFITDCSFWTNDTHTTVLAALNDQGASFEDIAYVIEKYL